MSIQNDFHHSWSCGEWSLLSLHVSDRIVAACHTSSGLWQDLSARQCA